MLKIYQVACTYPLPSRPNLMLYVKRQVISIFISTKIVQETAHSCIELPSHKDKIFVIIAPLCLEAAPLLYMYTFQIGMYPIN